MYIQKQKKKLIKFLPLQQKNLRKHQIIQKKQRSGQKISLNWDRFSLNIFLFFRKYLTIYVFKCFHELFSNVVLHFAIANQSATLESLERVPKRITKKILISREIEIALKLKISPWSEISRVIGLNIHLILKLFKLPTSYILDTASLPVFPLLKRI